MLRTYYIGDIHGMLPQLNAMLDWIDIDAPGPARVIFAGDYGDRGDDTCGVLDRIIQGPMNPAHQWDFLQANHDDFLIWFLKFGGPYSPIDWLTHGGVQTLQSYGFEFHSDAEILSNLQQISRDLYREMDARGHVEFLFTKLQYKIEDERNIYVHAGLDCRLDLDQQGPEQYMWERRYFLVRDGNPAKPRFWGKTVVHGHTINKDGPELCRMPDNPDQIWRIGVDTGCFATGKLTCVIFPAEPGHVEFYQVHGEPGTLWPRRTLFLPRH